MQTFDVLFPKGSLYNGGKIKSCSYGRLNAGGPTACPKASIVGSGTGNAYADTIIRTRRSRSSTAARTRSFFTVLNNPARVQSPVVGTITKMSGKYAYKLHVVVPTLLQFVAGVPIELTELHVTVGKGSYLSTTSCGPGGKWPFSITTGYLNSNNNQTGSATDVSSLSCHNNDRPGDTWGGHRTYPRSPGCPASAGWPAPAAPADPARTGLNTVLFAEYAPHDCVRRRRFRPSSPGWR